MKTFSPHVLQNKWPAEETSNELKFVNLSPNSDRTPQPALPQIRSLKIIHMTEGNT